MRARRAKRGGIAQVNSMRADAPRINLAQVAADARALLRRDGNYRRTVLTIALMMALTNVPIMILNYLPMIMAGAGGLMQDAQDAVDMRAMVFSLMVQLLVSPAISLGLARYELNMYNGRPCSPMDLFEGLTRGHYFVSVRAMLWRSLSMFVWMLIPVSLLTNGLIMAMAYGQLSVVLWLGLALVLVVLFNRGLAYSQQFYFLAQEPHVGAIMSLRLSTMVMHGRLKELFCLYLRFFYCFILTALPNVVLQVMANTTQLGFELTTAEQALVGVGVTLATIVLTSLCMPVLETASAIYFVRLNEILSRRAEELRRAHEDAFNEAAQSSGSLPGWGEPNNGSAPGGDPPTDGNAPSGDAPNDGNAPSGRTPNDGSAPSGDAPNDGNAPSGSTPNDGSAPGADGATDGGARPGDDRSGNGAGNT